MGSALRISAVSDATLVNSNYRAYQPLMALARHGHEIEVNRTGEPRYRLDALMASDAVLVHRYADRELQEVVRRLLDAGVGVVWDNDDDVTAIPRSNPLYRSLGGAAGRRRAADLQRMVRLAHVVTTPSARLARMYEDAGARDVRVLENFMPPEFASVKPRKHAGITLVWLAGLEHQIDYQQLRLMETFRRLLDAHGDLRILSIGLGLGLKSERYEHVPIVDFFELARALSVGDIGIAPLVDIPWNQARSNVKVKEYASAGLPWLASPVGAYAGMGEEQGGRLVPDDRWFEAIDALIADGRARRKLAKRAAKWAKGQTIDKRLHLWERAFEDAISAARGR